MVAMKSLKLNPFLCLVLQHRIQEVMIAYNSTHHHKLQLKENVEVKVNPI